MCDFDPPEFFVEKEPKAQKEHMCEECFGTIEVGEKYSYISGKWDLDVCSIKTCLKCRNLFKHARDNEIPVEGTYSHTGCIYYGELHEVVRQSPHLCPDEFLSVPMMKLKYEALM